MKIGFIGSGNMCAALVSGMLKNNFNAKDIYLSDTNPEILSQRQQEFSIQAITTQQLACDCEIIILAIKPQIVSTVCAQIKTIINQNTIVVSIAAGITLQSLKKYLQTKNIIRTMPNTPALVGCGATGIYSPNGKNPIIDKIFSSVGICVWVNNEGEIDIITALSGSGPAYFFLIMEYMIEIATLMGLDQKIATDLVLQTIQGSSIMAKNNNLQQLRARVTSKDGTTAAAIVSFEENDLKQIIFQAITKAKQRAVELANDSQP